MALKREVAWAGWSRLWVRMVMGIDSLTFRKLHLGSVHNFQ